jgi:putative membrane protein insertion efficiency factor
LKANLSSLGLLAALFVALIKGYQILISPFFGAKCRYLPSCSEYATDAIGKYGPLRGALLAVKRILRCHPWGGSGYDPLP